MNEDIGSRVTEWCASHGFTARPAGAYTVIPLPPLGDIQLELGFALIEGGERCHVYSKASSQLLSGTPISFCRTVEREPARGLIAKLDELLAEIRAVDERALTPTRRTAIG